MKRKKPSGMSMAIAEAADYPVEALAGAPVVSIEGNWRLDIEGCRSVEELSELRIRLDMGVYTLSVVGSGMTVRNLSKSVMTVEGEIHSVSLEGAER